MQSMHNDNTTAVLVCVLFNIFLCPSLFDSPLQGLAHLKAEQGTPFFSFLYCFFFFFPLAAWLGFGPFALWAFTTCPSAFVCCSAPLLLQRSGKAYVCVCLCVYCEGRMHSGSACSSSHLRLSLSLSMLLCLLTLVSPRFLRVT